MAVRSGCRIGWIFEERAQATVELAVVAPVLIALALISYNMMVFLSATARFDRVAPDIVLAHGSSSYPDGAGSVSGRESAADAVRLELERAMEGYDVEIDVESTEGSPDVGESGSASSGSGGDGGGSGSSMLGLVGSLRTFRCTMSYRPWPQGWSIAGIELGAPFELRHERPVAIDPWRSGVVV